MFDEDNVLSSGFKRYRLSITVYLKAYRPGMDMSDVIVDDDLVDAGHPKMGDYLIHNGNGVSLITAEQAALYEEI